MPFSERRGSFKLLFTSNNIKNKKITNSGVKFTAYDGLTELFQGKLSPLLYQETRLDKRVGQC